MYTFKAPPLITEQFLLPSSGRLYRELGNGFDGHITLRPMTTLEERMRVGSQNFYESMVKIVNECIVDNKRSDGSYIIDSANLTLFDFDAICVKLRIMTYGPEYKTYAKCTKCGHVFKHIADLRDCEFVFMPDDFVEPYTIGPLPMSNDTLGCRFLRVRDRITIDRKVLEIKTKQPDFQGDPAYTIEMAHRIMEINGEPVDSIMCPMYVEHMIGGDSDYYHKKIDNYFFGVKKLGFTTCNHEVEPGTVCGGKSMYVIRSDEEFFRCGRDY